MPFRNRQTHKRPRELDDAVMKILFVCTGNVDRSKTAEDMFKDVEGLEVRSAGTNVAATVRLSKELVEWADRIFVMEHKHQKAVLRLDPSAKKKTERLDIPDRFYYDQPELRKLLRDKLRYLLTPDSSR